MNTGYGVFIVREQRWRRATCDAHPDAAVVWKDKEEADMEATMMLIQGFGVCEARPFDWSAEEPQPKVEQ